MELPENRGFGLKGCHSLQALNHLCSADRLLTKGFSQKSQGVKGADLRQETLKMKRLKSP